ncbi:MAG: aminotransferase class I/II-fold pyridoxal phosphate-dependent enzyme [Planctomycetales bacterium]|nr:aminotransferase class I/II-fold pyridoxal phosphate-dependent enzyme [Planctomycetales bacterium]
MTSPRDTAPGEVACHQAPPQSLEQLEQQRALVARAYDPELLRLAGQQMVEQLASHLSQLQRREGPVHHWCEPEQNVRAARETLDDDAAWHGSKGSESGDLAKQLPDNEQLAAQFVSLAAQSLQRGQNLQHPRYIGHQVPAPLPLAGLFDLAMAVTNQVQGVYEMGPWAVATERAVIDRLGETIGLPRGEFGGLVTSGGSLANLTALLTARNVRVADSWTMGLPADRRPVLVAHQETHYSVARAAGVLGLGAAQVVPVALDRERRMDPAALDRTLAQLKASDVPVVAVVSVAGATPTGAYDPLSAIADVCERHEVWLHVDAAHGGAACLSDRHRHLLDGLSRADSIVLDAHKMMFMPALCAFVFYRDRRHRFATFEQSAPYLFDPTAPGMAEFDNAMVTMECTKRAAAIGLWAVWSLFGDRLFAALVDTVFETARTLHRLLDEAPDFDVLAEPTSNIVVFRHTPDASLTDTQLDELQWSLRRRVIQNGAAYLTQTKLDGRCYLRSTIMNPLTTEADLRDCLAAIRAASTLAD